MKRPLKYTRIVDTDPSRAIVDQVRARVQDGTLNVGDQLPPERAFAEQLGVSRNTVRKAVSSLVQLGLVTVRKGATGGAFISDGNGNTLRTAMMDLFHLQGVNSGELTEARMVLSQAVVCFACERCTPQDIEMLEQNVASADAAIARGDVAARMAINIDFYRLLGLASHNQVLTLLMDSIGQAILQFVMTEGLVPADTVMPVRREILACLRTRDSKKALKAITAHLQNLDQHYKQLGQKNTKTRAPAKARAPAKR